MSYKSSFQKVLNRHFSGDSGPMQAHIEEEFELIKNDILFSKTSKNPMDRRMEIAGYFLATIKALDRERVEFAVIRELVINIAHEYVRPKNRLHALAKRWPARLVGTWFGKVLVSLLGKKLSVLSHPDGFRANILTRKEDTLGFGYGFDIVECGICKLFQKHDYQRFASLLCEVDYITSGLAGLRLHRSGTIALGAKKCDFRFEKMNHPTG